MFSIFVRRITRSRKSKPESNWIISGLYFLCVCVCVNHAAAGSWKAGAKFGLKQYGMINLPLDWASSGDFLQVILYILNRKFSSKQTKMCLVHVQLCLDARSVSAVCWQTPVPSTQPVHWLEVAQPNYKCTKKTANHRLRGSNSTRLVFIQSDCFLSWESTDGILKTNDEGGFSDVERELHKKLQNNNKSIPP